MRKIDPKTKMALELGPLVLFMLAFFLFKRSGLTIGGTHYDGIVAATIRFMPAQIIASIAMWRLAGRMTAMQGITLFLVVGLGGAAIWLNDPRVFKMKPTAIYVLFGVVLGLGLLLRRNWLGLVLGDAIPLTDNGWRILTARLTAMCFALAVINEIVWRTQSDETWVLVKTIGLPVLFFAFFVLNAGLFSRYALPKDPGE
ncbi:MAG: intracellular septation protein A [Paracoccus denitrificans]|nr:MAG: intracellular septation protein A [Paracoccus denitrificans]PZO84475.1 MAG: intracellular septation protein A [Paracoccus denitrificans]